MSNKKITVYAICKNEEKFVDRWFNSMKEADEIVVLDTGSNDNTVKKLINLGVKVKTEIISPWRFDVARNKSLEMVSQDTDICVCTDLDEIFEEKWRDKLEKTWKENTTQLKYKYVWNTLPNGKEGFTFLYEKIHSRKGFKWIYPVHEILSYLNNSPQNIVINSQIVLRHFPDNKKDRTQYLKLLEMSVKEYPNCDRNVYYLGREYYFYKQYKKAIKTLKKHLSLKTSIWNEERSSSLRLIGNCYYALSLKKNQKKIIYNKHVKTNKKDIINNVYLRDITITKINYYLKEAENSFKKAIKESPNTRENFLELAKFYYNRKKYILSIICINAMFQIQNKPLSYITSPECWNEYPYDLLSMCYYHIKNFYLAKISAQKALDLCPNNKRIQNNLIIFNKEFIKSKI